ncbi:uncharacterized protein LAESUDRAFT_760226 [Laetiporus sulphureus 93-53]|uniref:Transmembrane protein n=1 Tax=Laetiporus sulphureus 93-53 TaxID=1314785 RepID=A0A165DPJ8_9APHY|nr:uncharacterized protein LAESUDRAFT_760226 [Laetiporus sulphureus 93-53]KZT05340.1 hypothetical protein LAESUDRAFT_760226 [Laetiporus sulphureus 93-53]
MSSSEKKNLLTDLVVPFRQFASSQDSELRQAILQVITIWLNRLALVSGIATFFASIDSLLFSLASSAVHLGDPSTSWSATDKLTTATFAGALIFHICAAIIAFVASFILVRLQLVDADEQEAKYVHGTTSNKAIARDVERDPLANEHAHRPSTSSAGVADFKKEGASSVSQDPCDAIYQRVNVQCLQLRGFRKLPAIRVPSPTLTPTQLAQQILDPPIMLLQRCHTLAVWMSAVGFVCGLIGILAYAWAHTPLAVSIFSTACLGVCTIAGTLVLL